MTGEKVEVRLLHGGTTWAVPRLKHPAVFSGEILAEISHVLDDYDVHGAILDPFAGKGLIEHLWEPGRRIVGVELEPEWAACAPETVLVGDSTNLPTRWRNRFAAWVTSCCYGNRFADHHNNRDFCKKCKGEGVVKVAQMTRGGGAVFVPKTCPTCKGEGLSSRRSYTHDLGRKLTDNNAGAMHYGPAYRTLHRAVWEEMFRVTESGGLGILNVKDHVRNKRRVRVSEWHRRTLITIGFEHVETVLIPQRGLRHGANRERIPNELLYVFRKGER